VAQGTIGAMVDMGLASPKARIDYDLAGTEALKKLTAHLTFASEAWFGFMKAAMNRREQPSA